MERRATLFVLVFLLAAIGRLHATRKANEDSIKGLELIGFVEPVFPVELQMRGIPAGDATAAVSRNAQGEPVDILIIDATNELFGEATAEAVRQWRFSPNDPRDYQTVPPVILRVRFSVNGIIYLDPTVTTVELNAYKTDRSKQPLAIPTLADLNLSSDPVAATMPVYPTELKGTGVEGAATVAFYIDGHGKVRLPYVVSATRREFGEAALAAVTAWQFAPPRNKGSPAVVAERWSFEFKRGGKARY